MDPSGMKKPSVASPDVRQRILDTATRLFVAHGYHGLSMREIAEGVGVSKAGLYYYFKDKETLFLGILVANLEKLEQLVQTARQAGTTTREQIGAMMHLLFAQSAEQRAIIRLASQEMSHLSREARATFNQVYHEKFIDQVAAIMQAGIERGELREMDVHLATWILLGMVYPFLYPAHEKELGPPEAALELILNIFFEGAGSNHHVRD